MPEAFNQKIQYAFFFLFKYLSIYAAIMVCSAFVSAVFADRS